MTTRSLSSLRHRLFLALEPPARAGAKLPRSVRWLCLALDAALVLLILASVTAVVLESVPRLAARHALGFRAFELLVIAVFTIEYGLRVWVAPEAPERRTEPEWRARLRYMATPMAWIDLVAILPFYLSFVLPWDLTVLLVARVLRLFKLAHYFPPMALLLRVLENELKPIFAALFTLALLMIIAASLVYWAEHEVQPEAFGSIPDAMWWAVVTLTTVGYGDVTPVTLPGRVVSGVIMVLGVGMVALPAGLLASGFADELHRRRAEFGAEARRQLAQGRLDERHQARLDEVGESLGLNEEQIREILAGVAGRRPPGPLICPHCGRPIPAPPDAPTLS